MFVDFLFGLFVGSACVWVTIAMVYRFKADCYERQRAADLAYYHAKKLIDDDLADKAVDTLKMLGGLDKPWSE